MSDDWPDPSDQSDDLSDRLVAYCLVGLVIIADGLWLVYLGEHGLALVALGLLTALLIAADAFSGPRVG